MRGKRERNRFRWGGAGSREHTVACAARGKLTPTHPPSQLTQVPADVSEADLLPLFSAYGPVRSLHLLKGVDSKPRGVRECGCELRERRDEATPTHTHTPSFLIFPPTGCAMVLYSRWAHAEAACTALDGADALSCGRALVCHFANPRRGGGPGAPPEPGIAPRKLFVGQVPRDADEGSLRPLFEPFGPIESISILRTLRGASAGCAFVQYASWAGAEAAMEAHAGRTRLPGADAPLVVKFADARRREVAARAAVAAAAAAAAAAAVVPGLGTNPTTTTGPLFSGGPGGDAWSYGGTTFYGDTSAAASAAWPSAAAPVPVPPRRSSPDGAGGYGSAYSSPYDPSAGGYGGELGGADALTSAAAASAAAASRLDGLALPDDLPGVSPDSGDDVAAVVARSASSASLGSSLGGGGGGHAATAPFAQPLPPPLYPPSTAPASLDALLASSASLGLPPPPPTWGQRFGPSDPPSAWRLFVGQVPVDASEADLHRVFAPIGDVAELYVLRSGGGKSRGCAFVTYTTRGAAAAAIAALDGAPLGRVAAPAVGGPPPRRLVVRFADRAGRGAAVGAAHAHAAAALAAVPAAGYYF